MYLKFLKIGKNCFDRSQRKIEKSKEKKLVYFPKPHSIRGALVTILTLGEFFGFMLTFILQHYFGFYAIPKFVVAVMLIFAGLFVFFPESPLFLIKQNRIDVSEKNMTTHSFIIFKYLSNHSFIHSCLYFVCRMRKSQFVSIEIFVKLMIIDIYLKQK